MSQSDTHRLPPRVISKQLTWAIYAHVVSYRFLEGRPISLNRISSAYRGNLVRKAGTLKMQDRKIFDLEFRKLENLLSVKLMYANNVDLSSIQWRAG